MLNEEVFEINVANIKTKEEVLRVWNCYSAY